MKQLYALLFVSFLFTNSFAQESPFGVGEVNNQDIGVLDDPSVVFASNTGYGNFDFLPDPDELLESYTYDLYIPESYDGTEPYGLVTWINSGSSGTVKSEWKDVLDENKLIWVGGDNIGNPIFIDIRMGVAWAAVYRMKEVLNIDDSRIYTSGNSGGARMANTLAYLYPEWISGSLPNCGGSYPIEVAQDYETHDLDSHYEVILPLTIDDIEYIKSYEQRYGMMTSYGDFREGDIMNIYHNGMEPAGFEARFFEKSGGHCATATWHFEDAVHFVDHSFDMVIDDQFDGEDAIGSGYLLDNTIQEDHLILQGDTEAFAQLKTRNIIEWNDPKGAIFRTTISLDDAIDGAENTAFHLGFWDYAEGEDYCTYMGNQVEVEKSGILISVNFDSENPQVLIEAEDELDGTDPVTLFDGTFSDWSSTNDLDIKVHLWNREMRVEFNHHFNAAPFTASGITFLDDSRSVQCRWEGTEIGLWEAEQWENGAFITLASNRIDLGLEGGNIAVSNLVLKTDLPSEEYIAGELSITQSGTDLVGSDDALTEYQWFLDGEAIPGETTSTLENVFAFGPGIYQLNAIYTDGCAIQSNLLDLTNLAIEKEELTEITVFPNPFIHEITVTNLSFNEIQLFDALGKNVTDKMELSSVSGDHVIIRTNGLSSGIYFLVSGDAAIRIIKE